VAVELPATLEEVYLDAIQRLPQISVIFYNDSSYRRDGRGAGLCMFRWKAGGPVCGSDPQARQEVGAQVVFADPGYERASPFTRYLSGFLRADFDSAY